MAYRATSVPRNIVDAGARRATIAPLRAVVMQMLRGKNDKGALSVARSMQHYLCMRTKEKRRFSITTAPTTSAKKTRAHRIEGTAVAGAIAGAAAGVVAGPAGAIAGGVIGGAAGAVAGLALSNAARERHARAAQLDKEIGVTDGDLGTPSLKHPPARVGAYSDASAGTTRDGCAAPSEGPIQDVDV